MPLEPLAENIEPRYPALEVTKRLRRVAAVTSALAALCLTGCSNDAQHTEPIPLPGSPPPPEMVTQPDAGVADENAENDPVNIELRPGGVPPRVVLPQSQDGGASTGGD